MNSKPSGLSGMSFSAGRLIGSLLRRLLEERKSVNRDLTIFSVNLERQEIMICRRIYILSGELYRVKYALWYYYRENSGCIFVYREEKPVVHTFESKRSV